MTLGEIASFFALYKVLKIIIIMISQNSVVIIKNIMGFYRRPIIVSLLLLLLLACDSLDFCYYSDDFGDSGDFDMINLAASENNCYYNSITSTVSENTNETIKTCLRNTSLTDIATNNASLNIDFSNVSKVGGEPVSGVSCAGIDVVDTGVVIEPAKEATQEDANVSARNIFSTCVDTCQDQCAITTTPDSSAWVKANIKDSGNFIGIKIEKNVYISMTVSGNISLDSDTSSADLDFRKLGVDDTNYDFLSKEGENLTLNVNVNKNTLASASFNGDITNLLGRSYLDFVPVKNNLVASGTSPSEIYKFQRPNFGLYVCNYISKDAQNHNEASCKFSYAGVSSIGSVLDSYYNGGSSVDFYTVPIFVGDYYDYASDAMDRVSIGSEGDILLNSGNNVMVIEDGYVVKTMRGATGVVEGFVWNSINTNFAFSITKPAKIAIKYIGNEAAGNCTFSIKDNERYVFSGETVAEKGVTYSDIKYEYTSGQANKWKTLRSGGNEIVFNQYAVADYTPTSTITLTLTSGSPQDCTSGLAIKLLPFKEYRIAMNGLLFFYIPLVSSVSSVKYTLLNRGVLDMSGVDQYYRVTEFYEFEGNLASFADESVSPLSSTEAGQIYKPGISDSEYNDLVAKAVFVRKGQILRLDYSNWLTVDNSTNIALKTTSVTTSSGNVVVDQGIGLSALILEKPPYFCYGEADEIFDVEGACMAENGTYSEIILDDEGNRKGVCFISIDSCIAGETTLVSKFTQIDHTRNDCKIVTSAGQPPIENYARDLAEFWTAVYTAYNFVKSSETTDNITVVETCNSNTTGSGIICQNCYNDLINKVYEAATRCADQLSSAGSDYAVYKGFIDGNGDEIYRKEATIVTTDGAENDNSIVFNANETTVGNKVLALNKLFVLKSSGSAQVGQMRTHFYYYKKLCRGGTSKTDCTVKTPQCYSLANYRGRFSKLLSRMGSDISGINANINGNLSALDIDLGAGKLNNFSEAGGGLIKNFIKHTENAASITVKYNKNIYSSGSNFFRFFIINNIDPSGIFANGLSEFNRIRIFDPKILNIFLERSSTYKNGERLAVFIGEHDKNYTGNPGSLKSGNEIVNIYPVVGNNSKTVFELVKYKNSTDGLKLDESTNFRFDSHGILRSAIGGYGVDFSASDFPGNDYVEL
ncbi:MAG: hypothetical protein LBB24_00165, partial [Rickettsiales bacterium]|nr:hypothetical protein [Rickettsiales bacterium]